MNKKICFSSMIREKRGSQNVLNKQPVQNQCVSNSLRELMQDYIVCPNADYVLRYSSSNSLRACSSKQDFEQGGYNQLDQWISSQIQHVNHNKENISDTQPRRQIPNQLLKYTNNGLKSPRRMSQIKSDFVQTQQVQQVQPQRQIQHKNIDMVSICRQYMENKKNGKVVGKSGPVWKFAPKINQPEPEEEDQPYYQPPPQKEIARNSMRPPKQPAMISSEYERDQNQNMQQSSKAVQQVNFNRTGTQSRSQNNIMKIVEEIKGTMLPEIEVMAQRILHERTQGQDQELLISQRESQEQRDQKRMDKAKKQIGEYLSMKNGASMDYKNKQTSSMQPRKTQDQTNEVNQQKQHVGYSFSSDFQSQQASQQCDTQKRSSPAGLKKQNETSLNPTQSNKISLPNIDEVKSQRDGNEKVDEDFTQSVPVNIKNKAQLDVGVIDKNFIKQIQSVAYMESPHQLAPVHQTKYQKSPEIEKKGSLFQQISKTAMSIDGNAQEESQQVNISVAQGKDSPLKFGSNKGSAKNNSNNRQNKSPQIQQTNAFVIPAAPVKIQFKKVPSPERQTKSDQNVKQPHHVQMNPTTQYFAKVYTPANPTVNFTSEITAPKHSFTSVLQQNTQTRTQPAVQTPSSTITHPISFISHQTTPYTSPSVLTAPSIPSSNPSITAGTLTITPTHIPTSATTYTPSSTPYTFTTATTVTNNNTTNTNTNTNTNTHTNNTTTTGQHVLNSRQRNNSLKHSGAGKDLQDSNNRKLKITISPKYNTGDQQDNKHDNIAVADFKLNNAKMEQSTDANTNKYPSSSTTTTVTTTTGSAYPPKSTTYTPTTLTNNFNTVSNTNTNTNVSRYNKVDSHYTNVTQTGNTMITQNREVHQEVRDRPQEHAVIRMQKYQRIQKIVQPQSTPTQPVTLNKPITVPSQQQQQSQITMPLSMVAPKPSAPHNHNINQNKQSMASMKNKESIKNSQQFEFDLDF